MTIGDRIRRIRKKRRLTQAELAMMSGLSLSAIQGYEQGRYEPKRKPLESIAEVFKIPVDELYDMPAEHGTNLVEVGTDAISKQQAIDAFYLYPNINWTTLDVLKKINEMPTIQPDNGLQKLTDEIASFKRCVKSDNSDYLTGYLCALSAVEGMIAEKMGVTT